MELCCQRFFQLPNRFWSEILSQIFSCAQCFVSFLGTRHTDNVIRGIFPPPLHTPARISLPVNWFFSSVLESGRAISDHPFSLWGASWLWALALNIYACKNPEWGLEITLRSDIANQWLHLRSKLLQRFCKWIPGTWNKGFRVPYGYYFFARIWCWPFLVIMSQWFSGEKSASKFQNTTLYLYYIPV